MPLPFLHFLFVLFPLPLNPLFLFPLLSLFFFRLFPFPPHIPLLFFLLFRLSFSSSLPYLLDPHILVFLLMLIPPSSLSLLYGSKYLLSTHSLPVLALLFSFLFSIGSSFFLSFLILFPAEIHPKPYAQMPLQSTCLTRQSNHHSGGVYSLQIICLCI